MLLVLAAFSGDPVSAPTTLQPGTSTGPVVMLDPCASAAANATATLIADDDDDVLNSGTAAYASQKCTRFVADFNVAATANPADSHGTMEFDLAGGITATSWQSNKALCEASKVNVTVYKKAVGATKFSKLTSAAYKGVFSDGGLFKMCNLEKTSGTNPPSGSPNASGQETYRVAVRATQNNVAVPVSARIAFDIIPW
jgi:hypothetical protein